MLTMVRAILTAFRNALKALFVLAFIGMFALNIATVTISSVYDALSAVVWQVGSMVWDAMPAPKQKRAELEADNIRLKGEHAKLEADHARLKEEHGKLQADKAELKTHAEAVEADNARIKGEARSLRTDLDVAEAKVSRQADDIKNLTIRSNHLNDELAGALGAAKKAENALLSQKANLTAAAELSDKIARRSANAVTRNTLSLPAEAVPIIGISIVIAVTAWDVVDLCSTMNDMAGIKALVQPADPEQNAGNDETRRYCGRTSKDLKSLFLDFSKQPAEESCAALRKRFPTEDLAACEDIPLPALPELEAKKEELPLPTIPDYN